MVRRIALWGVVTVLVVIGAFVTFFIYEYNKSPIVRDTVLATTGQHPAGYTACLSKFDDAMAGHNLPSDIESDCRTAADTGDQMAQFLMGRIERQHANDDGRRIAEAVRWYELSAKQDNYYAMYDLGMIYFMGSGVSVDYEKAMSLFMPAAQHKYVMAQIMVANMYAKGKGVSQDPVQAVGWLIIASKGEGMDNKNRSQVQEMCDKWAAALTPDQLSRANQMASKF